ncbi:MAG: transcriptional repressor [Rhodospirillales bacterium]|nr:transcriptional repressor [Rhodospirillales bacterium]
MQSRIERICADKGLKMTDQRRIIAQVLSESADHPDVDKVYQRAAALDSRISIATVYRTVRLFEEANILEKHDFGDGRARYEETTSDHHDHLINIKTGEVIEFYNSDIEVLKEKIAKELGYDLVDHRLELYAMPSAADDPADDEDVSS